MVAALGDGFVALWMWLTLAKADVGLCRFR